MPEMRSEGYSLLPAREPLVNVSIKLLLNKTVFLSIILIHSVGMLL